MTWASKLKEKLVSPLDAWEFVPNEDPKDLANTESLLKFDDLVLAVLEKNKEIDGYLRIAKESLTLRELRQEQNYSQARAFRELVSAVEKVKK